MVSVVRRGSKLRKSRSGGLLDDGGSEHHSVSVRKIDNGFIVSKSKSDAKGYKSSETFHEKKPTVDIQSIPYLGAKIPKSPSSASALRKASGIKPKNT